MEKVVVWKNSPYSSLTLYFVMSRDNTHLTPCVSTKICHFHVFGTSLNVNQVRVEYSFIIQYNFWDNTHHLLSACQIAIHWFSENTSWTYFASGTTHVHYTLSLFSYSVRLIQSFPGAFQWCSSEEPTIPAASFPNWFVSSIHCFYSLSCIWKKVKHKTWLKKQLLFNFNAHSWNSATPYHWLILLEVSITTVLTVENHLSHSLSR